MATNLYETLGVDRNASPEDGVYSVQLLGLYMNSYQL